MKKVTLVWKDINADVNADKIFWGVFIGKRVYCSWSQQCANIICLIRTERYPTRILMKIEISSKRTNKCMNDWCSVTQRYRDQTGSRTEVKQVLWQPIMSVQDSDITHHRRVTLMCKAEAYMEFGNASSHNIDSNSNLLNGSQRNDCTAKSMVSRL